MPPGKIGNKADGQSEMPTDREELPGYRIEDQKERMKEITLPEGEGAKLGF